MKKESNSVKYITDNLTSLTENGKNVGIFKDWITCMYF